jgi:hypothetical protein
MAIPGGDRRITIGLDLGQARNHTALVVLERVWSQATASEFLASGSRGYNGEYRYTVVGADRLALGTPYPRVVGWVKSVAESYGGAVSDVVVDASGVGSAVVDALRRAEIGIPLIGVVITGEQASGPTGGGRTAAGYTTVSRTELLTKLQVMIQERRFRVDKVKCREWDALRRELMVLRLEGKSRGAQDDLAFALALAVWRGVR